MKPCGKPWKQLSPEEKIEALHKAQEQFRLSLNKLARLIIETESKIDNALEILERITIKT